MSEEQQAVLEENQDFEGMQTQGTELPEPEKEVSQVDSAPTEEDTETEADGVQKRINKLTAEKYAKDRKIAVQAQEIERLKTSIPEQPAVKETQGAPTLDQFDFDEDQFRAALIKHEVNQQVQEARKTAQQEQSISAQRERDAAFDNAEVKYATENPDYIEVVQNLPIFPTDTLNVIREQENGPALAHYLGKNLDVAENLASLNPYSAAVEIGRITAKLSAKTETVVKTSTAPDPITPVTSGGAISKNPEDMSMEEIYAS